MSKPDKPVSMDECKNCRFRHKSWLDSPCATGAYQMHYSKRCFGWKPLRWWQKVFEILAKARGESHG